MCPPGVDQTTRGSPVWTLIVPELEQRQPLPGMNGGPAGGLNDNGEPCEFLRDGLSWGAFEKLARVPIREPTTTTTAATAAAFPSTLRPSTANNSLSPLETLPLELRRMIDAELSPTDQLAVGLCSRRLWHYCLGILRAAYRAATVAPWAGCRLACTSTWLTELPAPIRAA